MYEIKTYTKEAIGNLKNASLKRSLNIMLTASNSGRSALWKFAKAVAEIITKESFKDDFESQTDFAKFVDLSKSTITNYVKAVEFINRDEVKDFFQSDIDSLSVGKAYMLSTLDDENIKDFFDFITAEEVNILDMSDRQLRDMLKEMYTEKKVEEKEVESEQFDVADESTDESADESTDESADESTDDSECEAITAPIVTVELQSNNILCITFKGKTFCKERLLAIDDEIIECIKADFGA